MSRKVVVGTSGVVTSAWCLGWALDNYPREEVIALFHDTKEEDADTYRYLHEITAKLGIAITERSDGRSLTEVVLDEGLLPNDEKAFCSRILKQEPGNAFIRELQEHGATEIIRVIAYSANEPARVQRQTVIAWNQSSLFCPVTLRFPMIETGTTKQDCSDWSNCKMGVTIPAMYEWSDHANCPGCFRGGKAYWLAVKQNRPEVFEQRKGLEADTGFTIMHRYSLVQIETEGMKRKVNRKESINIGPCECGS